MVINWTINLKCNINGIEIRVFAFFAFLSAIWAFMNYLEIVAMNEELEESKAGCQMMEA